MSTTLILEGLLYCAAALLIVATVLPLSTSDHWTIRVLDFPRKQIAGGLALMIIGTSALGLESGFRAILLAVLLACLLYQLDHVIQYTPLVQTEVKVAVPTGPKTDVLSVLTVNVEVTNRDFAAFRELISRQNPDLILVVETNEWWCRRLKGLTSTWRHAKLHPRTDPYGISLLSKRPFRSVEIHDLADERTPAIRAEVPMGTGETVTFWGVHPRPPHPIHEPSTTFRDAELVMLGRRIRDEGGPTIVSGDLNDVSWSHTTDLFRRTSGLLDPRRGRGFYNTFHARYPFIRYPLDHTFSSKHFRHQHLEVLPAIGSDHYPVLAELQYDPRAAEVHDPPKQCSLTKEWAEREMENLQRQLRK